jgi:CheY-like chemotaxis protein
MMIQQRKRILVADDDAAICDVVRIFLEDVGYDVEITDDAAVLRDFPNGRPDLLLLDIWMSGCDGREICRALKSNAATTHLPILLFSASRDAEQIARDAGADGFVAKPFDFDNLLDIIERHL